MNSTIAIHSQDNISVTNSKGRRLRGFIWDGTALRHPLVTFTPTADMAARITTAITEARPMIVEERTGLELSRLPEAERTGYKYSHILHEIHGVYRRETPAVIPVLPYTPADFVR